MYYLSCCRKSSEHYDNFEEQQIYRLKNTRYQGTREHENIDIGEFSPKPENFDETIAALDISSVKQFKCKNCNALFKRKSNLTRHIKEVHEKKKPFQCKICNSTFTQKHSLISHIKAIHDGEKPFKCISCDASFTQKSNLVSHVRVVHEKNKSHKV